MRCRKGGSFLACVCSLFLLSRVASSLPISPLELPSLDLGAQDVQSPNVSNAINISEVFPIPNSELALRFWAFGNIVDPWTLQSILIISGAFLQEQISLHGDEGRPLDGGLEYDSGGDLEILIRKMPEDPDGLDWAELQDVIVGLWEYIVEGRRYRTTTFDVLNVEDDAQIGWGHIVALDQDLLSNGTAKRGLQTSALAPPSSASSISGQRNSSLSDLLGGPVDWPVKDSDMTLRLTSNGGRYARGQALDPEAIRNLFVVVIEIASDAIADKGEDAEVGGKSFRYGNLVVLEVINSPHMLTWGQFATVILGLVDFVVDHNHYHSWYFTIYVGDPKVECGIGKLAKGIVEQSNVTLARRDAGEGGLGMMQRGTK